VRGPCVIERECKCTEDVIVLRLESDFKSHMSRSHLTNMTRTARKGCYCVTWKTVVRVGRVDYKLSCIADQSVACRYRWMLHTVKTGRLHGKFKSGNTMQIHGFVLCRIDRYVKLDQ
jgi:hypothetical protein